MKFVFTIFFVLFLLNSYSADYEGYRCVEAKGEVLKFLGNKNSALYSNDKKVIHVFSNDGNYELKNYIGEVCFDAKKTEIVESEVEKEFSIIHNEYNNQIYNSSIIGYLYFLIIGIISIVLRRNNISLLNPLKFEKINFITLLVLLIFISLLLSYVFTSQFISSFLIVLVFLFLVKLFGSFIFSKIYRVDNNFQELLFAIFKTLNYLFLVQFFIKNTLSQNLNFDYLFEVIVYTTGLIFILSTIANFLNSNKKIRLTHLFYYLCALEILPVLFLKEYYLF